jgi:ferredoxin like protein
MSETKKKLTIEEMQYLTRFAVDDTTHIEIKDIEMCMKCVDKPCTYVCPGDAYKWECDRMSIGHEGCHECGTCRIVCPYDNINWSYPKGGKGIVFRLG